MRLGNMRFFSQPSPSPLPSEKGEGAERSASALLKPHTNAILDKSEAVSDFQLRMGLTHKRLDIMHNEVRAFMLLGLVG